MNTAWQDADARILAALDANPSRVPVVVGGDACGRTTALRRIAGVLGRDRCHYLDMERVTSTPERFLDALSASSPFDRPSGEPARSARAAFEQALGLFDRARTHDRGPASFVLDEWLELQTFEHFPGLRTAVTDTVTRLAASSNRFLLGSRFVSRTLRRLANAGDRFIVVTAPGTAVPDVAAELMRIRGYQSDTAEEFAQMIVAITGGRAGYANIVTGMMVATPSPADPISSLVAAMSPGAPLDRLCRYSYEYRLHRARGYGALKAILGILALEEPLTLTDIAVRMGRTAGSTRDYLGWLEDVDLIVAHRKHYSFTDPLLRAWVSIFDQAIPPSEDTIAAALQRYAVTRLSAPRAASA